MSGPLTIKLTSEEVHRFSRHGSVVRVRCGDVLMSPKNEFYLFCCNDSGSDSANTVDERQLRHITDFGYESNGQSEEIPKQNVQKKTTHDSGVFLLPTSPATEKHGMRPDSRHKMAACGDKVTHKGDEVSNNADKMAVHQGESSLVRYDVLRSKSKALEQFGVVGSKETEALTERRNNEVDMLKEALSFNFIYQDDNVNNANEALAVDLSKASDKKNKNHDGERLISSSNNHTNEISQIAKNISELLITTGNNRSCSHLVDGLDKPDNTDNLSVDYNKFVKSIGEDNTSSINVSFADNDLSNESQEMVLSFMNNKNESLRVSVVPYSDSEISEDDAERSFYQISEDSLQLPGPLEKQAQNCVATKDIKNMNDDYMADDTGKKEFNSDDATAVAPPKEQGKRDKSKSPSTRSGKLTSTSVLLQENMVIVPVTPVFVNLNNTSDLLNELARELSPSSDDVRGFRFSAIDTDSSDSDSNLEASRNGSPSNALEYNLDSSAHLPEPTRKTNSKHNSSVLRTSCTSSCFDRCYDSGAEANRGNEPIRKRRCGYTVNEESWFNQSTAWRTRRKSLLEEGTVGGTESSIGKKGSLVDTSTKKRTLSVDSVGSKITPKSSHKLASKKSKQTSQKDKPKQKPQKSTKEVRKSNRVKAKVGDSTKVLAAPPRSLEAESVGSLHATRQEKTAVVTNITNKKQKPDADATPNPQNRDNSSSSSSAEDFDQEAWEKFLQDTEEEAKVKVDAVVRTPPKKRTPARKRTHTTDTEDSEPALDSDWKGENGTEVFDRVAWKKLKLNDSGVKTEGYDSLVGATQDRSLDSDHSESFINSYSGLKPGSPKLVPPLDDLKLLDLVGLRILKDLTNFNEQSPNLKKRSFQKAKEFAKIFGPHQLLWRTKNRFTKPHKHVDETFQTLQNDINQKFGGNLNISETKRLVNLVLLWYRSECIVLQQLNNQVYCDAVRAYFNLFKFVPQTILRTYYCEYCPMQLQSEGNYFGHRLRHTGQTHYICGGCLRGFMRFKSYLQHEEVCPYQDNDECNGQDSAEASEVDIE